MYKFWRDWQSAWDAIEATCREVFGEPRYSGRSEAMYFGEGNKVRLASHLAVHAMSSASLDIIVDCGAYGVPSILGADQITVRGPDCLDEVCRRIRELAMCNN